jgi:hypothetical protein
MAPYYIHTATIGEIDVKKEVLQANVITAKKTLADAEAALTAFEALPENNVFETLPKALSTVEDKLLSQAHKDCEGSYNCGQESYTQGFIVDGAQYLGTLTVEYNRHDKTYYYIDGSEFTYAVVTADNGDSRT